MKMLFRFTSALLFTLLLAEITHASCRGGRVRFFVDRDETYKTDYVLTDGARFCVASYTLGGTSSFSGMKVVVPPKNGTLGPHGAYSTISFRYNVNAGFKGTDFFAIRICGENRGNKGCATIEYDVLVK